MTFTISNWISQGFVQADKSQAVIQIARNSFLKGKKYYSKLARKLRREVILILGFQSCRINDKNFTVDQHEIRPIISVRQVRLLNCASFRLFCVLLL